MTQRQRIFGDSLVVTLIIFLLAFSLGLLVEHWRASDIVDSYKSYELEALDLKLQNYYFQTMSRSNCDLAIEQNYQFADTLYSKGLILEKYEENNQITDTLLFEKKRYVLLKTELWLNALLLKEKCNADFDTLVYFYSADPANSAIVAQQKIISNVLRDIKGRRGDALILLPIAGDLGLDSIDLQMRAHNVSYLPSLLINEETILEGYQTPETIEHFLTH
jgi:hypothetical protein